MDPETLPEPADRPETPAEREPAPDLPSSLIPRWLAGVVLFALVAAGVATAWLVIWG